MRFQYFYLLLLFIPSLAAAQYTSRLGRFQVDEKKGCAPLTVTILNTNLITFGECTGAKPCDMDWGDGTAPQQNQFTHTYTQPGTYLLRILYQTIGFDDITIIVTPNTQPSFDIFTCGNREVQVRVTDTNYDSYIINYNDATPEVAVPKGSLAVDNHTFATTGLKNISVRGKDVNADDNCTPPEVRSVTALNVLPAPFINLLTVTSSSQINLNFTNSNNIQYRLEIAVNSSAVGSFQLAQTVFNNSTTSISNLRTDDNFYCFRLGAFDPCNNVTVYSNIICSSKFDLSTVSNQNNLTWTTPTTGVSNFTINRDGSAIGSTGTLSFADNNVVCKNPYCYQLFTNYGNGSQSVSLEKCGTAFSSNVPTPIMNVTAVVISGSVDLIWQQDPTFVASEYRIFRKSGNGNLTLYTTNSTTQYLDADYSTDGSYCYRIDYMDVCDNVSPPGAEICPIRLSGNVANDNTIQINWNNYVGWINGVDHYEVEKYNVQGVLLQTFSTGSNTLADNIPDASNQLYRYVVKAEANDPGLGQAVSNEITLVKAPNLFYPKAFTPDNQGPVDNEIFKVFGQFIVKFEMKIFNRWGELMFTTNDLNEGWDGKYKGTSQPEGTYAFIANITDLAGRKSNRSGSVVLLRKK